ncbi:helix-turn-helix domain-containing protein [Arthrobacter celericrescens]|uniref:helix-turn-helix domain-containing protein n=1 Tax=Arthrobacter celericrescens TaxID=2320851 RepID=UPI000EA19A17|nr:helix-turn-helix domain-containing protein [Arthrobacter celericrescens]
MHNESRWTPGEGWDGLLTRLAAQVPRMAAGFVERISAIPEYASGGVTTEELLTTAKQTFEQLVAALRNGRTELDGELASAARALGGRRARAGIPPESLMSAVRLDFPVIWTELLALVDPADGAALNSRVEEVWNVVDQYATQTRNGYLDERVRMAHEEAVVERDFIAQVFAPGGQGPESLQRIGAALGLDPEAALSLAAARGEAGAVLRTLGVAPAVRSRVYIYESGDLVYGFWKIPAGGSPLPPGLSRIPCGLVPSVRGLAGIRDAALEAEALARVAHEGDDGPLDTESAWPRVARRLLEDARLPLRAAVDRSLEACRPSERERLEETARSILATGNVTATAAALFCHRNTILNRMARFQEVTGIDLSVPEQAARLVVAWA